MGVFRVLAKLPEPELGPLRRPLRCERSIDPHRAESTRQQLKALALRCQATVIASVQVGSVDLDRLEALSLEHPGLTAIADSVLFVSTEAGGTRSTLTAASANPEPFR